MIKTESIMEKVIKYRDYAIQLRQHFHQYPELGSKEFKTSQKIREELDRFHIPYEIVGNTGIAAFIKGRNKGGTIAVRGDMDALPINEENDLSFKSVYKGIMHACGHDLHISMVLTAARILNEFKEELSGSIKLFFEEGEEIGIGARMIVDAGYLEDVDSVVALHACPEEYTGYFRLGYGERTACSINSNIELSDTESTVMAAAEIMDTINAKLFENSDKLGIYTLVPTICDCSEKTESANSCARLFYNGRFLNNSTADRLEKIIAEASEAVAKLHGARAAVKTMVHKNSFVQNDKKCVDCAIEVIEGLYGKQAAKLSPPAMFSDTFAFLTGRVPGLYLLIGSSKEQLGSLHNEKVIFQNETLQYGIGFLTVYLMKMLKEVG